MLCRNSCCARYPASNVPTSSKFSWIQKISSWKLHVLTELRALIANTSNCKAFFATPHTVKLNPTCHFPASHSSHRSTGWWFVPSFLFPFLSFIPFISSSLEEDSRLGGISLEDVCAAVKSGVALADATLLGGHAVANTASLQSISVKRIEQVS